MDQLEHKIWDPDMYFHVWGGAAMSIWINNIFWLSFPTSNGITYD